MTVSTASIPVLHSAEVAHLYPQVVSYASCSSHLGEMSSKLTTSPLQRISLVRHNREELDRRRWGPPHGGTSTGAQTKHRPAGGAGTIEAYYSCPAGKLLQTKKT